MLRLPQAESGSLDEKLAPAAERAYRNASRSTARDAMLTVRVCHRLAVIEKLEIDGRPIRDVARDVLADPVR